MFHVAVVESFLDRPIISTVVAHRSILRLL